MINLKSVKAILEIEKINIKLDALKLELEKFARYEIQGIILKTKARWIEQAEKNTKYFFGLEKTKSISKSMQSIKLNNGQIVHDQKIILSEQKKFFQQLYTKDNSVEFSLNDVSGSKLDATQKIILDSKLTLEEISNALRQMPKGKCPGPDGIPADFYKVFWGQLKKTLLEVFLACKQKMLVFDSARQGIISLIPKKGKDQDYLRNWRPITLLNTDYKILSKAIANRIKLILTDLIDPDQTGFVKGRDISENLRKLLDLMEITAMKKLKSLVVLVDLKKAFDRVDIQVLLKIMKLLNFGEQMIEWVSILFSNFSLATSNYGYLSEFFVPTQGLFQGNPIAPYLYLLMGEILCRIIKANPKIEGVKVGGMTALLSQFADDLVMYLNYKESVWQAVIDTFSSFQRLTGLKISYEKTTIYRIGSLQTSQAKFYSKERI